MELRKKLISALVALVGILALSVAGYMTLGPKGTHFLDALYMAVITLAGVGYGEIVDTAGHPALRIFNMFIVVFGVMITVYAFSSVTAFLVEGEITNIFWRRRMLKQIAQLKEHFIVCGLGDTGRHAVEELQKTHTPFVVVDHNEENIKRMRESSDEYREMLYVVGDASDAELLEQLNIDEAKGLISTLPTDKENLIITVLVRQKNPDLRIVARCIDPKFSERILRAGANSTVSPNRIGGMRIASEVLRPHVVGFLDMMLKDHSRTLRIEEIEVKKNSQWIGKNLGGLDLRTRFNLLPMAVKDDKVSVEESTSGAHHGFRVNPADGMAIVEGMVIIVMGDVHDIKKARHEAAAHHHLIGAKA